MRMKLFYTLLEFLSNQEKSDNILKLKPSEILSVHYILQDLERLFSHKI